MNLTDRLKDGLEEFIRRLVCKYDYSGVHGYTVVSQNSDFTLELRPDDPDNDPTLSNVPIKYDSPSNRVTVKPGATCNVMYTNKDPSRYFAFGFDPGDYDLIEIGTDGFPFARQGDLCMTAGLGLTIVLAGAGAGAGAYTCTVGTIAGGNPAGGWPAYIMTGSSKGKCK
jgi:hypothetical protein